MIVLDVDNTEFFIGDGEFFFAFFSTVAYNLEKWGWGSRFPCIMKKLYMGKLSYRKVDKAKKELLTIRRELKALPVSKLIWDIEDLNKQPPWGNDINDKVTDLSNYFVTYMGEDLFGLILAAFETAKEDKRDIHVESVDYSDAVVTYVHFNNDNDGMGSGELNKMLVESFPNLKEAYLEEVEWQEGDDTGSHVVYGDVFTPYVVDCIENNREKEMLSVFSYIERLLEYKDTYVESVITVSVIESVSYLFKDKQNLYELLGEKSKVIMDDFLL